MNDLANKAASFIDVALTESVMTPVEYVENKDVTNWLINEAASVIGRAGTASHKAEGEVDPSIISFLKTFGQGRIVESVEQTLLYHGKDSNGIEYFIKQRDSDYVIYQTRKVGGTPVEVQVYGTAKGALSMLESQVPTLSALQNNINPTIGASQEDAVPQTEVPLSNFAQNVHESCCKDNPDARKALIDAQHAKIAELRQKIANSTSDDEYTNYSQQHAMAVAELASMHTGIGTVRESVNAVLHSMGVESLDQLDESTQDELVSLIRIINS